MDHSAIRYSPYPLPLSKPDSAILPPHKKPQQPKRAVAKAPDGLSLVDEAESPDAKLLACSNLKSRFARQVCGLVNFLIIKI
jgi:hypothetical protein